MYTDWGKQVVNIILPTSHIVEQSCMLSLFVIILRLPLFCLSSTAFVNRQLGWSTSKCAWWDTLRYSSKSTADWTLSYTVRSCHLTWTPRIATHIHWPHYNTTQCSDSSQ